MTTYTVSAKRWAHGWELHIRDGRRHVGVTQSRTLDSAEHMVRDYIESLFDVDTDDDEVVIQPRLGGLESTVRSTRRRLDKLQLETREAAAQSRATARELRLSGLSVSDVAYVLGVSRARASQLAQHQ